ncbi:hypothetical protein K4L06_18230 [Lysobacter sp. BMK333-48F3]|uniref:C2 family cysteine protease n=1 Tax=Lysobacter sp. BMK333-48F3 TaxID=2867962 RepID=UPI001C8B60EE|nr:C2 family cysteine protease [Lysobacter sp. BMK333-48F3]MBX9403253.1 hypothetical protein [Lysobacter sp. BMK333-48F3]
MSWTSSVTDIGQRALQALDPFLPGDQAQNLGGDKKNACDGTGDCKPIQGETKVFEQGAGDGHAVDYDDIAQGGLNDCYVVAGIGAVAAKNPELVKNAVRDNGDGTYTVTFYEKDNGFLGIPGFFGGGEYKKVEIKVDGNFSDKSANGSGDFVNGKGEKAEIWPKIVEKAYAQYKGGYDAINHGGNSAEIMSLLTGHDADQIDTDDYSFEDLKSDLDGGKAVVLGTPDDFKGVNKDVATKHGLVDWHVYTVVGVKEENGQRYVEVYNPHGTEGVKKIPFDEAMDSFSYGVSSATK